MWEPGNHESKGREGIDKRSRRKGRPEERRKVDEEKTTIKPSVGQML